MGDGEISGRGLFVGSPLGGGCGGHSGSLLAAP